MCCGITADQRLEFFFASVSLAPVGPAIRERRTDVVELCYPCQDGLALSYDDDLHLFTNL